MSISDLVNEGFDQRVAEQLNAFSPTRAYKVVRMMGFSQNEARSMIKYYLRTVYQPVIQMYKNKHLHRKLY